jgi:hypothetical protein
MNRLSVWAVCVLLEPLLLGCGAPQPSQDSTATEIAAQIFATQTAFGPWIELRTCLLRAGALTTSPSPL